MSTNHGAHRRYALEQRENSHGQRRYDHDRVLDLWCKELTSSVIAERLNMSSPTAVRTIVVRARAHGDPRAIERGSNGQGPVLRLRTRAIPQYARLVSLAQKTKTSVDVYGERIISDWLANLA